MKLSISTIAWSAAEDAQIVPRLSEWGVTGVEVAPTRAWDDLMTVTARDVGQHRAWWDGFGLRVVAMQALLYGQPDLALFGDPDGRRLMVAYLERVIAIGAGLGAGVLVFGSPRQRRRGALTPAEAESIALPFFRQLGDFAVREGTLIGLEPNPPEYECDFLTTNDAVASFVKRLDHAGVAHHFDLGGTVLSGESPADAIHRAWPLVHFHASAPHLGPLATVEAELGVAVAALSRHHYDGWVSIEMRRQQDDPIRAVEQAIRLANGLVAE